jgi:hypothetical protein
MNVAIRTIVPSAAVDPRVERESAGDASGATWVIEELTPATHEQPPLTTRDRRVLIAVAAGALLVASGLVGRWLAPGASDGPAPSGLPVVAVRVSAPPVAAPAATPAAQPASAPAGVSMPVAAAPIVIRTVEGIDRRFVEPGSGGTVLAVWMETGSTSTGCLATLNEAVAGGPDQLPGGPITMYCAARDMRVSGAIRHGLFLHLFLGGPMVGDGHYDVNVYQQDAAGYGTILSWVDPYAVTMPLDVAAQGTHDGSTYVVAGLEACYANGWATDPDHWGVPVQVRILADGQQVWSGAADSIRGDVRDAGIGDGRSGFSVQLGGLVSPGVPHEIRAQAHDVDTGEWVDLVQTPRTITCTD